MARGSAGYSDTPLCASSGCVRTCVSVCCTSPTGLRALLDGVERFDITAEFLRRRNRRRQ